MRAAVRSFHSPDADLDSLPRGPVSTILIQMMIGPAGAPGEESFDVVVCSADALARKASEVGPVIGRHYLIIESWDPELVLGFLRRSVEALDEPTWVALAEKISRIGRWEFEDYVP